MDETRYAPPVAAVEDVEPARPVVDVEVPLNRLHWAANACLLFAVILLYRFGGVQIGWRTGGLQVLLVLAMAFGVYQGSRVCAVLATLDFALDAFACSRGATNPVFMPGSAAIGVVLLPGMIAAFQCRRLTLG